MFKRILVPTDGSDITAKAVATAHRPGQGARRRGATRISVKEPFPYSADLRDAAGAAAGVLRRAGAHRRERVKRRASTPARPPAWPARRTRSRRCTPGRRSSTTPRRSGCDLIVMASHGRRGVAALLLGSETQKVLTHTHDAGARRALSAATCGARGRACSELACSAAARRATTSASPPASQASCAAVSAQRQAVLQLRQQVGHGHVDEAARRHHQQVRETAPPTGRRRSSRARRRPPRPGPTARCRAAPCAREKPALSSTM